MIRVLLMVVAGALVGALLALSPAVAGIVLGALLGGGGAVWLSARPQATAVAEPDTVPVVPDVPRPWPHDLVKSLVSAAVLFDHTGHVTAANSRARELLGIPDDGVPRTVLQALGSPVLADAVARAREGQRPVEVEADVGDRTVAAAVAAVGDGTLVMLSDRTREQRVQELRRNFVVNASHELKTPATAIQALSEALEITARNDPDRVPDLVVRLREESERLVRMVHDLLDLRRLEDRGELQRVAVDLVELVRQVLADQQERADERGVDLHLDGPQGAPLLGDPEELQLVVRNLVANAVQYNQSGGRVDVRIHREDAAWAIEVADTGIGIPKGDVRRIFERFYRVDVARSRQTGGTGLGLSLVRHAVQRHRGNIRVDSLLGEGTTVRVWLPTDVAPVSANP